MFITKITYGNNLDLATISTNKLGSAELLVDIINQNKQDIINVFGEALLDNVDFKQHVLQNTQYFNIVNIPQLTPPPVQKNEVYVIWYTRDSMKEGGYSHECIITSAKPVVDLTVEDVKQLIKDTYFIAVSALTNTEIFVCKYNAVP